MAVCRIVRVSGESEQRVYGRGWVCRGLGRMRVKEPFHGMKMYAKNQEVAACLPAAEKLKYFRLRGERCGEHQTPNGRTEAASTTTKLQVDLFISSVLRFVSSFFFPPSRWGIAGKSCDEVVCIKMQTVLRSYLYLKEYPSTLQRQ